jgi:hypothetical protein
MTEAMTMGTSKGMMVCFLMVILLRASKRCDDVSNPPSALRYVGSFGSITGIATMANGNVNGHLDDDRYFPGEA